MNKNFKEMFNVDATALPDYTEQMQTEMITKAIFGSRTVQMLSAAGQVQAGIKYKEALALLDTDVVFQDADDDCTWQPSGTTTFTQRDITVSNIKIQEDLCPKKLRKKWLALTMAAGNEEELPFSTTIGDYKSKKIGDTLETAIWIGNAATSNTNVNTNKFDGFARLVDVASASTVAGNTISATSVTTTNIDDIVTAIYNAIPDAIMEREDLVLFMSIANFKKYTEWLRAANLFHFAPDGNPLEAYFVGTNLKIKGVKLSGTYANRMICTYVENMVIGTDLDGEFEQYSLKYDESSMKVRFAAYFKMGCQIVYPDLVVRFAI
jgi:hypothetical protein